MLASRLDLLQRFASFGEAEPFLLGVGRACCVSLEDVRRDAEASSARLRDLKASLHMAIDTRCVDLEQQIRDIEGTKVAALELELVSIETTLEQWNDGRDAVNASTLLDDTNFLAIRDALDGRLSALQEALEKQPTAPVEPSDIDLIADEETLRFSIASFGRIVATRATTAPLILHTSPSGMYCSGPGISSEGIIVVPDDDCPDALVFGRDGVALEPIVLDSLGLSHKTRWAAFSDGDAVEPLLLLGDRKAGRSKVVAVNPKTRAVVWSLGLTNNCHGIATLSHLGIAVVAVGGKTRELAVISLKDGSVLGKTSVGRNVCYVADDEPSCTVFVGSDDAPYDVLAFSLERLSDAAESAGAWSLVSRGAVATAGSAQYSRPLTVVPPSSGRRVSHLVVGTNNSPVLRILALPRLFLVHEHTLTSASAASDVWDVVSVLGLAADPLGKAIAVCDGSSDTVGILAWPLPGMP